MPRLATSIPHPYQVINMVEGENWLEKLLRTSDDKTLTLTPFPKRSKLSHSLAHTHSLSLPLSFSRR